MKEKSAPLTVTVPTAPGQQQQQGAAAAAAEEEESGSGVALALESMRGAFDEAEAFVDKVTCVEC